MTPAAQAPETVTPVDSDGPALAPGVELIGKLQGSGFADDQWLVRRGGGFIQLTELLYRVAEAADGRRTVDEVAAVVTAATPWLVTGDQIRTLVETKLRPLGIVDVVGASEGGATSPMPATAPSIPLGLQVRARVVPARVVDMIARPFGHLYWGPVVLAVLLASLAVHAWIYFGHGVARSALQVLYAPGLLLVIFALLLVAAAFHELGHAAALVYGGGRPGNMGAGFFMVYPAFYTDVSDSYRLSRWARLRTDLGGIYFHLIAALVLVALYLATGQEFLLLAVVLIDVEAIRQLIPFGRLDGYWVFADLTGIPDPFSLAAPFVRRFTPAPGPRLPPLKRWVEVAFALFLLLAVPALVLFLTLFLLGLPALFSASWDSAVHQLGVIAEARNDGNSVGLALALLQLAFVVLTVVAALLLVYSVARSVVSPLWRWSAPRLERRVAVAGGTLGVCALVGALWAPQLPFLARPAPPGTQVFEVTERAHVYAPVTYPQTPPAGGVHAPLWQNCGFYSTPVRNEYAVHSLEHGAVWITYRPELPDSERAALRNLAYAQVYVLVSPYPGLPAPVVASAWGRQLRLDSAEDPLLNDFLKAFRLGPQAPERGRSCTGGFGTPE